MFDRVSVLEKRLITIEKRTNVDLQRARETNIELHGIPDSVGDDDLKSKTMEILSQMNINLFSWDFQGIHRLPRKKGMV